MVTHWKYHLLILLELSLCVSVVFILLFNVKVSSENAGWYKGTISDKPRFAISLADQEDYFNNPDIKNETPLIISAIKSNPSWSLYTFVVDSFALPYQTDGSLSLPEKFEAGYEDGNLNRTNPGLQILKAFGFTQEVFQNYDMQVSDGRLFDEKDFVYTEGEPYPVLLGAEYKDFYKVGDIIEGSRQTTDDKLIVIGFLKAGTLFANMDDVADPLITLDRYIIYPLYKEEIHKDGTVEEDPLKITDVTITGGTLVVSDTSISVQDEMNKITNTYGFPAIRCTQYSGAAMKSAEIVSQRNVVLFSVLAAVLCVLAILSIGTILKRRTEKEMLTYGMYMVSGIVPMRIISVLLLELLAFSVLAVMPSIWISYYQFRSMVVPVWQLFCVSFPILLISFLPARKLISRVNLDQIIRRKSE
jgi:hypothetical protein